MPAKSRPSEETPLKLRLAITGSSGYLAQQLIVRLASDPDCEFLLGLDIRPAPSGTGPRTGGVSCPAEFLQFDLTAPWEELAKLFRTHSINAGLHFAWQFNPIHDRARHRRVDVEGSRNFFLAAEAAGLRRIVYPSSTTTYVSPSNPSAPPFPNEKTPISGTRRYLYSKHKVEVELMAQEFMARHPDTQVIVLRASIVLGPHTQNIVSRMMDWPWRSFPWMFQVRGADPPMQFLSEEDSSEVLYRAVKSALHGVFIVAGDGVVRFSELARAAGKRPLAIPAFLLYPATAILWRLRLAPFPAGILDMIRYSWVAENTKLKAFFEFTPQHTSRQALDSFLAARAKQG